MRQLSEVKAARDKLKEDLQRKVTHTHSHTLKWR